MAQMGANVRARRGAPRTRTMDGMDGMDGDDGGGKGENFE